MLQIIASMYMGITAGAVITCFSRGLSSRDACFVGVTTPMLLLASRLSCTPISIKYGDYIIFTDDCDKE